MFALFNANPSSLDFEVFGSEEFCSLVSSCISTSDWLVESFGSFDWLVESFGSFDWLVESFSTSD